MLEDFTPFGNVVVTTGKKIARGDLIALSQWIKFHEEQGTAIRWMDERLHDDKPENLLESALVKLSAAIQVSINERDDNAEVDLTFKEVLAIESLPGVVGKMMPYATPVIDYLVSTAFDFMGKAFFTSFCEGADRAARRKNVREIEAVFAKYVAAFKSDCAYRKATNRIPTS